MHVTDPSSIIVGFFVLFGTIYTVNSGRREREKQARIDLEKEQEKQRREDEKTDRDNDAIEVAKRHEDQTNLETDYKRVYAELQELKKQIEYRNEKLDGFGTNYIEMFRLLSAPHAMRLLRENWDKYQETLTPQQV